MDHQKLQVKSLILKFSPKKQSSTWCVGVIYIKRIINERNQKEKKNTWEVLVHQPLISTSCHK